MSKCGVVEHQTYTPQNEQSIMGFCSQVGVEIIGEGKSPERENKFNDSTCCSCKGSERPIQNYN